MNRDVCQHFNPTEQHCDECENLKNNCPTCNGECCSLEKREGTIRYSQLLPHGQGIHWCKSCEDGKQMNEVNNKHKKEDCVSYQEGSLPCEDCEDGKQKQHSSTCGWHKDWHNCDCGFFDIKESK